MAAAGVTVDHGDRKPGQSFTSDFSAREISLIQSMGFKTEVIIDDVSAFYAERCKERAAIGSNLTPQNAGCATGRVYPVPAGFKYGSMGGYPTLVEILATLDTLAARYPNIISGKATINSTTSIEGRPLYWVRISNNPNVSQSKPQILYTALHHAREPASVSQMLYYMFYLCENYPSDPEVKFLVDNTEMYFVPCINPDGYVYNQTTNPGGGGLWRKNRRNNMDGTYGVDLNRNYGFCWGYDNVGSSPMTSSDTYRGTAQFSEPETAMMKYMDSTHHFRVTVNYHTYGNDLIYPWGYNLSIYTPDSAVFSQVSGLMTGDNHFNRGTGNQTVGYTVNGDSDDWAYGDTITKPKVLAMTPEIGSTSDGFWPAQSSIIPICQNSLVQNLNAALCITKYAIVVDQSPYYLTQSNGFLDYKIKRIGLDSPATYSVKFVPLSPQITSMGGPYLYTALGLMQEIKDSVSFVVAGTTPPYTKLSYVISVSNGSYIHTDTITKIYCPPYTPQIPFSSDGSTIVGWSSSVWGISNAYYVSPSSSITDSPSGNYPDNADETITSTNPIDLTNYISTRLSFWARWQLEPGYDYTEFKISVDNGSTWIPQCGKYTIPGSGNQDQGMPLYNGFQLGWVKEEISLDDYIGKSILLRFELVSDGAVNYDGFYFDDLQVTGLNGSEGIQEQKNNPISIYQNIPNPARDQTSVHYQIKNGTGGVFKLFNALGQIIYQQQLGTSEGEVLLDTKAFDSGVYFYRIENEKGSSQPLRMVLTK